MDKRRIRAERTGLRGEVEVTAEFLRLFIRETSQVMIKEKHSRFIKRKVFFKVI